MSRNPKPLHLIQGHLTKEQKRQREEKEESINSNLKRDKIKSPNWLDKEAKKAFKYISDQYKEAGYANQPGRLCLGSLLRFAFKVSGVRRGSEGERIHAGK